ncbi:MAG: outer membrane beta-barrel protein [Rhodobacteraceae bacterium]|nr:outer membrane beta-barrel protein [Paracoccaceae bacterium]
MKVFTLVAVATTAATGFALPALAGSMQQPTVEAPVAVPVQPAPVQMSNGDWTGAYVGMGLGYDHASTSPDIGSGSSGLGSVFAGYNYDFGKFVLGGEVAANKAHANWGGDTLKSTYDAKLRGGVDLGKTMVYATVGGEHADGVHGIGTMVGAGVDYKLTDRVIVGGEAGYTKYNNADGAGTDLKNTTLTARVAFKF